MQFLLISILLCFLLVAHLSDARFPMGGSRRRNRRRRAARRLAARLRKEEQCKLHPEPDRFFLTFNEKGLIVNATQTCVGDITHVFYTGHADVYDKHRQTIYSGGVVNGLYSGEGNLTYGSYSDVGTFAGGALNGKGERFIYNHLLYKGDFVKGVYHGEGRYFYLNGDRHEGSFKNGLRHGHGTMHYKNGKTVTGTWDKSFYSKGNYMGWYWYLV
jgi:hypothetical protein